MRRRVPARWMQSDAPFWRELVANLPPTVRPVLRNDFYWRGRNSMIERARSANAFIPYIRSAMDEAPGAKHCIVAHSHGGNVVFNAVRNLSAEEQGRIESIICLATPFLHIEYGDQEGGSLLNPGIESVFLISAVLTTLGIGLLLFLLSLDGWSWTKGEGATSLLSMISMAPPRPVYAATALSMIPAWLGARWVKRARSQLTSIQSSPSSVNIPLIALKAPGDEAYLGISSAETLAMLFSIPLRVVSAVWRLIVPTRIRRLFRRIASLGFWPLLASATAVSVLTLFLAFGRPAVGEQPTWWNYVGEALLGIELVWAASNFSYMPAQLLSGAAYGIETIAATRNWRLQLDAAPVGHEAAILIVEPGKEIVMARHSLPLMRGIGSWIGRWCGRGSSSNCN